MGKGRDALGAQSADCEAVLGPLGRWGKGGAKVFGQRLWGPPMPTGDKDTGVKRALQEGEWMPQPGLP